MFQGHQRKDMGLILSYFSRIQVCACGREGWMGVSTLSFDSTVQRNVAVGFILKGWWFLSPSSPVRWWLHQRAVSHSEGLFWKSLGKNDVIISHNQTEQTKTFFPCIKSFIWHLLSSCSEAVLWRTEFCFHWDRTIKSLESSVQGYNVVWQLKSLETTFSFTESLLQSSFEVHDFSRSMLSCFIQNFILYSYIQHCIQNFPWFHQQ